MRKPRPFSRGGWPIAECDVEKDECDGSRTPRVILDGWVYGFEVEDLSRWLLKAAEWIRSKETER